MRLMLLFFFSDISSLLQEKYFPWRRMENTFKREKLALTWDFFFCQEK